LRSKFSRVKSVPPMAGRSEVRLLHSSQHWREGHRLALSVVEGFESCIAHSWGFWGVAVSRRRGGTEEKTSAKPFLNWQKSCRRKRIIKWPKNTKIF